MTISAMNWSQVEARLAADDRCVLPLGSTEQHAGLSLSVDSILAERVATDTAVKFHNWWNAPDTLAKVKAIDPVASHASWMENFPWTRLPGVVQPTVQKPMVDFDRLRVLSPDGVRDLLGDGNFGGLYERPDADMLAIWEVGVAETRAALEGPWS